MDERSATSLNEAKTQIRDYYLTLYRTWGPQHWWPGESQFEVVVGAVLVQNTAWRNVELALHQLRAAEALSVAGMRQTSIAQLEKLIRSAGFFRQKARALKNFLAFLDHDHDGSLSKMFALKTNLLRGQLLALRGIGPETADSILLYAGQHAVFVMDAYARRVLTRHGIALIDTSYDEIRRLVESALAPVVDAHPEPAEGVCTASHRPSVMSRANRTPLVQIYNEMHGLMVSVGKQYCLKSAPHCEHCPLQKFLPR